MSTIKPRATYGITKQTLGFYIFIVKAGFSHDKAMRHLAKLYANNKMVATEEKR